VDTLPMTNTGKIDRTVLRADIAATVS